MKVNKEIIILAVFIGLAGLIIGYSVAQFETEKLLDTACDEYKLNGETNEMPNTPST